MVGHKPLYHDLNIKSTEATTTTSSTTASSTTSVPTSTTIETTTGSTSGSTTEPTTTFTTTPLTTTETTVPSSSTEPTPIASNATSVPTTTTIETTTGSTSATTTEATTTFTTTPLTNTDIVEPPIVPVTVKPNEKDRMKLFNVTFNVFKLPFTPKVESLKKNNKVLDPASDGNTTVEAICVFKILISSQRVDEVQIYHAFQNDTEDITTLGSYSLDNNSLFVNGYHEPRPTATILPIQTTTPNMQTNPLDFNVTFVVTNLTSAADLQDPNSALFNSTASVIVLQLNQLFRSSNVNKTFFSCKVLSFSTAATQGTRVHANCTFTIDSDPQDVNRVRLYRVFRDLSNNITTLGPYSLDSNSLYVNGYNEPSPTTTISPIQTTTPNMQTNPFDFNVTFVVTNLTSAADLQDPNSALFNSTASVIVLQLNQLFRSSNVNKTFFSCKVLSFSTAATQGTRVHANCTFTIDSDPQDVNRVRLYRVFRDLSNNITTLGPYSLDSNSLYVNGYNEPSPTTTISPIQTTTPNMQTNPFDFNVTFVVTNLTSAADLQDPNSALFNSTASVIVLQLNQLFRSSNVNKTFFSCKVLSFSTAATQGTRVHANCTFTIDSDPQDVNRVRLYRVFRDLSNNITTLGPYSLDSNSLYVNGYNEPSPTTTISPIQTTTPNMQTNPFDFNVTFVVTNLTSAADLQDPNSALFNSTASVIVLQLNQLFRSSNVNKTFFSCKVLSFSTAATQGTRVHANCTFTIDSDPQDVNRVRLYRVFRDLSNNITTLGPYSLDSNSLYVNGYNEPSPTTTISPIQTTTPNMQTNPFDFNVTFVVTNLTSAADLQDPNSALFNSTASVIVLQLNQLFRSSNVNKTFFSCKVLSFSTAATQGTRVHANCTFTIDSDPQDVNRVRLYRVFRDLSNNITTLGPYSLDSNSLYVNGYNEPSPTTTISPIQTTTPNMQTNPFDFNVTFVVTNLTSAADLQDPNSALFNSTASVIVLQLNQLFRSSNVNKTFFSCKVLSFSTAATQGTRVHANCTFTIDSDPQDVNRVRLYRVFRDLSNNITTLGPYSLDSNSLYVNGYNEPSPTTTISPIQTTTPNMQTNPFDFNVTFVVTNLTSAADLQDPNSALFNSTASVIVLQLNQLFRSSNVNKTFFSCKVLSFSTAATQGTRVHANCTFTIDSDPQDVNRVRLYRVFRDLSNNITTLGPYSLDSNSLYVNGYNEPSPTTTISPIQTTTPNMQTNPFDFNVTFVVTNLTSAADLQDPNSALFNSTASVIVLQLNQLFRSSNVNKTFFSCKVLSFSTAATQGTRVHANCTFTIDSDPQDVNRVRLYRVFRDLSNNITTLGPYSLDSNSLYVNGYNEPSPTTTISPIQTTTPNMQTNPFDFNVTFVVTNLTSAADLQDPNSALFNSTASVIVLQLNQLFRSSNVNKTFFSCKVLSFSTAATQGTRVHANCTFTIDSDPQDVNRVRLYRVFRDLSNNITTLGPYSLDSNSLYVNGYNEPSPTTTISPIQTTTPNMQTNPFDFNVTFVVTNLTSAADLQDPNSALFNSTASVIVLQRYHQYRPQLQICKQNPFDFNVTFVVTNLTSAADLQDPNSALFNSTASVIVLQLNQLFRSSNVNKTFFSCKVLSFSTAATQGTRVHANCTFTIDSDPQDVNRVRLYRVFRDLSNNITTLGPYSLDSNSLYVNGYNEPSPTTTISPIQTTTPNMQTNPFDFNVTFVVTNLTSAADLQDPNSALFNSTASVIVLQLNQLFRSSNVNKTFFSCKVLSFSTAATQGTRVHANCTFTIDSDPQDVNRVRLYRVFRDLSNNITTLGPYSLDSNSLYVNGYNEPSPTTTISPIQTTTPNMQTNPFDFNVTFVVTNLTSAADLQDPNSALFNSTASVIVLQLNQLFRSSNVNKTFFSCKVLSFSTAATQGTRVHANCTFTIDSDPQDVNRVRLYRVFRDLSNNITTLGPYSLDSNSLYVNGYNEPSPTTTISPIQTTTPNMQTNPFDFNVTFVVTNLTSAADLQDPNSALFNSTASVIVLQLNQLFRSSNVNKTFFSCKVLSFSTAATQGTRVHANCTFTIDSDPQDVNRVRLYRVFRDLSNNITTLGPYSLDSNSLYVNGYNEPSPTTTISPIQTTTPNMQTNPFDFNVTFVVTNLTSAADLQDPNSALFNSTASVIVLQLNQLFRSSNVNKTFFSCKVLSFSTAATQGTRVHANCTFTIDSDPQDVNRVRLYRVFRDLSNNITTLGPYSLDSNSLYVNGYNEPSPTTTISPIQTTTPNMQTNPFDFNVTFVVTNLTSAADLQDPNSALFNSTASVIVLQLNQLFRSSNVNKTFFSCKVLSFSTAATQGTRVHANCTFTIDSDPQDVNRVRLYRVFRDLSNNITTLGPYSLDSNSLYVNGYNEPSPTTTISPIQTTTPNMQTNPFDFNVTFVVTNLTSAADLQDPNSALFNSTASVIVLQLNQLFRSSNVNKTFFSCKVLSFSTAATQGTRVHANCTFTIDSDPQDVNRVRLYRVFRDLSNNITTLGPYSLDSNSLYVNGYNEPSPTTTISPIQTTTPNMQTNPFDFNVTFVVTNLTSAADLQDPNSALFNSTASVIVLQLNQLFRSSNVNKTFFSCKVLSFSTAATQGTRVHANCTFTIDSDPQDVNRVRLYRVFRDLSNNITTLGPYSLDSNSLYVNGYNEPSPTTTISPIQTTTPNMQTNPLDFNVTFVVTNLTSAADLQDPNSALFNSTASVIVLQLNQLFRNSNVNKTFSSCRVLSFSPSAAQGTRVHANCTFTSDSDPLDVNRVRLYRVFRDLSNDITALGPYSLDSNSLYVNGYHESPVTLEPPIVPVTVKPVDEMKRKLFNVTFNVLTLPFTPSLQNISSPAYVSESAVIIDQLNSLFANSRINPTFSRCQSVTFRPTSDGNTTVEAICIFKILTSGQVDEVQVYHEFQNKTEDITTLGPYSLDTNSLFVNGYHEPAALTTTPPMQTTTPNLQTNLEFNVTFIATNLAPAAELQDPNSALFKSAASIVTLQLSQLFSSSKINKTFSSCRVLSFSPANSQSTRVHANCTFSNDSDPQEVNRVGVYRVFSDKTNGITSLQPYMLDSNSLYVNGYHEPAALTTTPPMQTTTPNLQTNLEFNVTFIATNLAPAAELQDPNSALFKSAASIVTLQLSQLFSSSKINKTFSSCRVLSFSPANSQSTRVHANCTFSNDSDPQEVNRVGVYRVFSDKTNGITSLQPYMLDSNSLYVNGYHEPAALTTTPPMQTTTPNLQTNLEFNVTFIATNLAPAAELQDPNSALFKSAASIVTLQLSQLFSSSKINKTFSSCRVLSFSPANLQSTRVHANCTFSNDSDPQEVNRVGVYRVFSDKTNGITSLQPYMLDSNSLYVNGYHETTPSTTTPPILTTSPNLQTNNFDFNVTFIATNLASTASLLDPTSALFKSAESIINFQLNQLFSRSNIKKTFSSCRVLSFSPENIQDTRVFANCTFTNETDPLEVNRVRVYRVFRDNTKDITVFGVYLLDPNSLFVNDYNEATSIPSTTVRPTPATNPFEFNVTFVITNLASTANLQDPNSPLYTSAVKIVDFQLDNLFRKSNIKNSFSSCKVISLGIANIQDTRVHANCTFRNDSDPQQVNRVTVYHVFRNSTKEITMFGVYRLDRNSLYVNDFHIESSSIPSTTLPPPKASNPFDFNVTFVITNLASTANLQDSNSPLHKSAASIIVFQLEELFRKSNIKNSFSSCRHISFSTANIQDTRVQANCTFKNDSDPQEVNKVTVYHELRDNTDGISKLGAYKLDSNSLYVNDYHESAPSPTVAPIPIKNPFDFNVTFTITNLASTESLRDPNSPLYKSAASIVALQLDTLFNRSNVKKSFSSCKVLSLSPENIQDTRVYANCTFRNDSDPQKVNKVNVYRVISRKTGSISTLGTYLLDSNSLFVNDYHETTSMTTMAPIPKINPFDFNVTFTITNLAATTSLQDPNSPLYKSAASIVDFQLNELFAASKLKTFSSCKVLSFSPENIQDTKVYANCTFRNDSDPQEVNRINVYRVFSGKTSTISKLGAYLLDRNRLFVNGYNEPTASTTPPPAQPTQPFDFNVTFVITNLPPTRTLLNPNSALHKSAAMIVALQLDRLFKSSKIKKSFTSCTVLSFSSANVQDSRVHANCTFRNDSDPLEVNKVTAYGVFKEKTKGITSLKTYSLDSSSLYVNGYTEGSVPDTQPNGGSGRLNFNVTFTITNFITPNNIIQLLDTLYRQSNLAGAFSNCHSPDFGRRGTGARIEVICSFKNDPTIDKVDVYNEFRDNTGKITELGQFSLNETSLYVNGYQEVKPTAETTAPGLAGRENDLKFGLTFTIINRDFTAALNDQNSPEYKSLVAELTAMLTALYQNSSLKDNYRICNVTGLRIGSIICTCQCFFDPTATNELVTADKVKTEFATGTNGTALLGNTFLLKMDSLSVEAVGSVPPANTEIPFWGIIIIVVGILAILFLISLGSLWALFYLKKKKHGSYDTMQNRAGLYFTHQRFQ
ncbi:mucin-16-like [Leucoraja erinacea]|uniref:mucin-16-like n=1 Tax=Leucoraja erinaceus TaxID=7782 RepID=UPI0024543464|nr:mucin-16-like [Leucoraja erinacea]